MRIIRTLAKKSIGFSVRCLPTVQRELKRGLTVFAFHDISDRPGQFAAEFGLAIAPATFRRQIAWIKSNFQIVHPADLVGERVLPEQAAVITFDDGFHGSFENGLAILEQMAVPSIFFLNMHAILEQRPLLPALVCFLDRHVPAFAAYCAEIGLARPFHLTLTPSILQGFEARYGPVDIAAVANYQGRFADITLLQRWADKPLVAFGNHLFEHWNACALNEDEFEEQYRKNERAISRFGNYLNLFAFTNGQPGSCFSWRDIDALKRMGAARIFASAGGTSRAVVHPFLLGRVSLAECDSDCDQLWFRMARAAFHGRKLHADFQLASS